MMLTFCFILLYGKGKDNVSNNSIKNVKKTPESTREKGVKQTAKKNQESKADFKCVILL